jgi:hypothetical protein
MAGNIGGYQMNAANARASAYQQQGAAQAGFANQLAGYAGYLGGQWGGRKTGGNYKG